MLEELLAKDYSKGTFTRFFAKDGRTGKVVELDKEKYLAKKKKVSCIDVL